jgi:two-component system, chemotaxis family, sensor kinase CheA
VNPGFQNNNQIRILVVDDSALMRTVLEETLLDAGFHVFLAEDGMDAWELLQNEPIHLVVADVYMPRLDGLELTRAIRADKHLEALPVILISATETEEDRRLGLLYGASAFIAKDRQSLDALAGNILKMLRAGPTGT